MVNCEHCTAEVEARPVPALEDSAAWAALAGEHDSGCTFVVTRDFRAHVVTCGRFHFLVDNDETNPHFPERLPVRR